MLIALVIVSVIGFSLLDFPRMGVEMRLKQVECTGVIDSIKLAGHGYPYFYIDHEWRDFGMFGYSMIRLYRLSAGDSVCKKMGEAGVLTFKRDSVANRYGPGVMIYP